MAVENGGVVPGALADAFASEASFAAWYARCLPPVYGYLYSRCGHDPDLAEELTQQTFVDAIRDRRRFAGRAEPVTWLTAIARHRLADHFRRLDRSERRHARLAVREIVLDEREWVRVDERAAIGRALGGLPALQRAALVLTVLDGLSVRETAALIGRTESATESLLVRARTAFREAYAGDRGDRNG